MFSRRRWIVGHLMEKQEISAEAQKKPPKGIFKTAPRKAMRKKKLNPKPAKAPQKELKTTDPRVLKGTLLLEVHG